MERIKTFMTDDGAKYDVPETEMDAFMKDAATQGTRLRKVDVFRDEQGNVFDVPEDELPMFQQDAQAQGARLERVNSVKTLGQVFDVPESQAQAFYDDWRNQPDAEAEREENEKRWADKFDKPESPVVAGIKGFFSPEGYMDNASWAGAQAAIANVFRGVAQAPGTIVDKGAAALQFASRVNDVPKKMIEGAADKLVDLFVPEGSVKETWDAIKRVNSGEAYRGLLQTGRDYVNKFNQDNLGFKNAKGEDATDDDFAVTIGAQAANAVTESFLLTAPKVMQNVSGMIREGAEKAVPKLLARLTPSVQTILYGTSTAESTAQKAQEKGRSDAEAVGLGLLTGTIEGALESVSQVFGVQDVMQKAALREAVGKIATKRAIEIAKDAAGETLTEGAQQFQQGAIERLSGIDEKSWAQIGSESARAAAMGLISGGASSAAHEMATGYRRPTTDNPAIMQEGGNTGGTDELRQAEEAAAVGAGEQAQRESVLEGEAEGPAPEQGAEQGQGLDGATVEEGWIDGEVGGRREEGGDLAVARDEQAETPRQGEAVPEPLMVGEGVMAEPVTLNVKGRKAKSVRLALPGGKIYFTEDPGLMDLVQYWYKDRVLFPPAPNGDIGRQEGDVTLNASRRAGYQVKPGKRVYVNNLGRSKKGYLGTIVQVLDSNTVRVKVDKTQRSMKNNRDGYADVDVRTLAQLPAVIGKQRRAELTQGMPKEQIQKIDQDARTFENEIVDAGVFIDQDRWLDMQAMGETKRGKNYRAELLKDAYRRAEQILGVPLENHVQRAQALEMLRDAHNRWMGMEGAPFDALQEQLAREIEQETQALRASGEFSLEAMTPEEMAAADATLEQQRLAEAQRAEMLRRAGAPIRGDAGDLTGIIPGFEDQVDDDVPLFGFDNGRVEDTGEELPFNMAPEGKQYNVAPEAAGAYNQQESGGAETPTAQETPARVEERDFVGAPSKRERFTVGMDLMDAVSMVYQLTGKFPKVVENMRRTRAMGYFDPNTKDVVLWAKIFGLIDDVDRARINTALRKKGYEGDRLAAQEAIEVKALMEKRRKEHQKRPLKVAVHELAHLVDFLPDGALKRGNILGHIAALKKHLAQAIGPEPGARGPMTEQEKAALRNRARREANALPIEASLFDEVARQFQGFNTLGIKPDDIKALLGIEAATSTPELYDWFARQDNETKKQVLMAAMRGIVDERVGKDTETITPLKKAPNLNSNEYSRKRFRELLRQEVEARRLIELKQIKDEAERIIPWWRGVAEMEEYFRKPEEMYAELMGIFMADPAELRKRAPTVYRAFAGWMDARPEVAKAYNEYLDAKALPAEQQARQKLQAIRRGMEKEDEAARREADELARQPGKWAAIDGFGYVFHRRTAPIKWALDRSLKTLMEGAKTDQERRQLQNIYDGAKVQIKNQSAVGRVIQQYEMDINERVANPLAKIGFDVLDMGVYQALRRVAFELDGKAAPGGVEPASALKLLESLREEYGEERWEELQKLSNEFRRIREEQIIRNPDLRAMFDKELLEKLDNNVEYVTFKHVPTMQQIKDFKDAIRKVKSGDKLLREDVAEFLTGELQNRLGSQVGAQIHKYVGSFGPIANPIVATLAKDDQLLRSAVRNTLRREIYQNIKESGLDLIRDVEYERNGKGMMVPKMVDDRNWKTVVFMQDGQIKGFLANRWLAKALETGSNDEIVALRYALKKNMQIARMYTQLKYTFTLTNNIKDLERAVNLVPGMQRMLRGSLNYIPGGGLISTLQRYSIPNALSRAVLPKFLFNDKMIEWNLPQARRAAILIQKGTINQAQAEAEELMRRGETRKADQLFEDVRLAREALKKPILMSSVEAIEVDSLADDYTRHRYKYGVGKQDLEAGLKSVAQLMGIFKYGARMVEGWGETGELTTKLATWKYLQAHGQNMTDNQKILITRELGGSPDFSERGAAASYIEFITRPFINAAKEGTIGTLQAFKDRPGETTRKMFTNVVAPTMVRHLLASGLGLALLKIAWPDEEERKKSWIYNFMQWYYDAMRNVPNYILKSTHSYPIPVKQMDGTNFTAVLNTPMDQTSEVFSLTIWNLMDSLGETLVNEINASNNPSATPMVLSRTERPGIEIATALLGSILPDGLAEGPILGIGGLIKGFFSGTNYYDSFKQRNVFDEDELIARGQSLEAWKTLGGEIWNRLGGSMIKRYTPDNIFGEDTPTLHKLLNLPMIQPTIGKFFNIYTGGQAQMERKLGRIEKEMEAPIKVEARADFERAVKEGGYKSVNYSKDITDKMIPKNPSYRELVRAQLYTEEFKRLSNKWYTTKAQQKGNLQGFMKAANEDNALMQRVRLDIMGR